MSLDDADDITGCHVGHPPTRWLCLRRSCPLAWVGKRAGLDGRRAAKKNRRQISLGGGINKGSVQIIKMEI